MLQLDPIQTTSPRGRRYPDQISHDLPHQHNDLRCLSPCRPSAALITNPKETRNATSQGEISYGRLSRVSLRGHVFPATVHLDIACSLLLLPLLHNASFLNQAYSSPAHSQLFVPANNALVRHRARYPLESRSMRRPS